jgi:hypothetical protein
MVCTTWRRYPRDLDVSSKSFVDVVQCHADVYRSCIAYNLGDIKDAV